MHTALWLLPVSIVVVKALIKLAVDKQATLPEGIIIALGLPFDVTFVASSLLAGKIISDRTDKSYHVGLFVVTIAVAIIAMILFRRAERLFAQKKWCWMAFLGSVNFALASLLIGYVVSLIGRGRGAQ